MPLIASLILSLFLKVNKISKYFILVSLDDFNALKTTFNKKKSKYVTTTVTMNDRK